MQRDERRKLLDSIPWVSWIEKGTKCAVTSKFRTGKPCKNAAHWKYKPLRRTFWESGPFPNDKARIMCMSHLFSQYGLWSTNAEYWRYEQWLKDNPIPTPEVTSEPAAREHETQVH